MHPHTRTRAVTILAAVVLGASLVSAAPAYAAEPDPQAPVVVDDEVTVWPGGNAVIDVLANDTDPAGDDLAVCRLPSAFSGDWPPPPLWAQDMSMYGEAPGTLRVSVRVGAKGTHTIDYYVCNHTRLTPATLTVHIRPVAPVVVTKIAGHPGRIQVANENDQRIWFIATDRSGCKLDSQGWVGPQETRTFRVRRHNVAWAALIGGRPWDGVAGVADQGTLRHVRLDGPPAPPAPDGQFCIYG